MLKICKDYLALDREVNLGNNGLLENLKLALERHPRWLRWKYIKYLRKSDFARFPLTKFFYKRKKNKIGEKLGIDISSGNNIGPGFIIHHTGIICNSDSIIGKMCQMHGYNCIGNNGIDNGCPIIGDYVENGVGAKIIGNVKIANNVKIGANAVVVKDILEEGTTWVGVPAQRVK